MGKFILFILLWLSADESRSANTSARVVNYGLLPECAPDSSKQRDNCYATIFNSNYSIRLVGRYKSNQIADGFRIYNANRVYIGAFDKSVYGLSDQPHGKGVRISLATRSIMKGEWENGNLKKEFSSERLSNLDNCVSYSSPQACFGIQDQLSNGFYIGELLGEVREGSGMLFETSGYYRGLFREGQFEGKGEYFFASGASYIGDHVAGNRHGSGVFTYPDGGSYEGEFFLGAAHGDAVRSYADGRVWMGYYRNGKKKIKSREFQTRDEYASYLKNEQRKASLARGFVLDIQELLKDHRYFSGALDGMVGPLTKSSLQTALMDAGEEQRGASRAVNLLESDPGASLKTVEDHLVKSDAYCDPLVTEVDAGIWSVCYSIQN